MPETTEEKSGIKKAARPKRIRTNAEPENPNPQPAEGLGAGDGTGPSDTVGLDGAPAPATDAEQPRRRGRPEGSTNKPKETAVVSISAGEVGFVYDGLGALKMWAAVRFFGVPADIAGVLSYTEEEKAHLAEPTAKVLSRLLPSLGKYKDEAALLFGLYQIEQAKIMRLNQLMAERQASLVPPGPVSVITEGRPS